MSGSSASLLASVAPDIVRSVQGEMSLVVHGSYAASYRLYDQLIVSDGDTWFYDILAGNVRTSAGLQGHGVRTGQRGTYCDRFFGRGARGASAARLRALGPFRDARAAGCAGPM